MDINTRLDGFVIHPLDAFNDRHHDDETPKFSSTAPHLDGFQVHPLDSFISHEHNNELALGGLNEINNYISNNETENIYSQNNINDLGIYQSQVQDIFPQSSTTNNNFNFNEYETTNVSSSENFITYTDPITTTTTNYNYLDVTPTTTISLNTQTDYINETPIYNDYPISSTNYETNNNFSEILPPKFLPPIESHVKSQSSFNIFPNETNNITFSTVSIGTPNKSVYSLPEYNNPYNNSSNVYNQFGIITDNYNNNYDNNFISDQTIYKVSSYSSTPQKYKSTTYNPKVIWRKIIPKKQTIIIPTIKQYVIKRKKIIIVPKQQSIIIPQPVLVQPLVPTIQVSTIQNPNEVLGSAIIPTISLMNQNAINNSIIGKFPTDSISKSNIYYPRRIKGNKI